MSVEKNAEEIEKLKQGVKTAEEALDAARGKLIEAQTTDLAADFIERTYGDDKKGDSK